MPSWFKEWIAQSIPKRKSQSFMEKSSRAIHLKLEHLEDRTVPSFAFDIGGTNSNVTDNSITTDGNGNFYVTGGFSGTVNFGTGAT